MSLVLGIRFEEDSTVVAMVQPASLAERLGVHRGDRIERIEPGGSITSQADYDRITANLDAASLRSLQLQRGAESMTLVRDFEPAVARGDFVPPGDYSALGRMDSIVFSARIWMVVMALGGGFAGATLMTEDPGIGFFLGAACVAVAYLPIMWVVRSLREVVRATGISGPAKG